MPTINFGQLVIDSDNLNSAKGYLFNSGSYCIQEWRLKLVTGYSSWDVGVPSSVDSSSVVNSTEVGYVTLSASPAYQNSSGEYIDSDTYTNIIKLSSTALNQITNLVGKDFRGYVLELIICNMEDSTLINKTIGYCAHSKIHIFADNTITKTIYLKL